MDEYPVYFYYHYRAMGCVLLVGDCGPLRPEDIVNSGHRVLVAACENDAWEFVLPSTDSSRVRDDSDVAVLGHDLSESERDRLLRWLAEEGGGLPVLVLKDPKQLHPEAFGYYSLADTTGAALGVVLRLLDGIARNGVYL